MAAFPSPIQKSRTLIVATSDKCPFRDRNWRFLAVPDDFASLARGKTGWIRKPPFCPLNYGNPKYTPEAGREEKNLEFAWTTQAFQSRHACKQDEVGALPSLRSLRTWGIP